MHRYTLLAMLPAVLGCANPLNNECASYMANNAATASAFCATFTQSVVTATADLPSWASACSYKPKHISKECSCHFTAGAVQATATAAPVETDVVATSPSVEEPVETDAAATTPSVEEPVQTAIATTLDTVVASSAAASNVVDTPASTVADTPVSTETSGSGSGTDGSTCGSAAVDELVGYGDGTTGGGSGSGTTVTSCSELESAISAGGVITISGILSGCDILELSSDTTIIGSGADSGLTGGGFRLKAVENVILRNLKMNDPPEGKDLIDIEESTYIWVDHCDLSAEGITGDKDFYDGLLDIKRASDFVTISWTKFSDHWKASLIGHSDSNGDQDTGTLHVTYHHNYWSNINSRCPSVRFGTAHIYSSCYEDIPTSGINSRMSAHVLVEQTSFSAVKNAIITNLDSDEDGFAFERNNLYTDSEITITQEEEFTPPYDYTTDPASCICELVKSKAGTGVVG
ncbi:pectin lyase fold/virulence factor [Dactylonectria macrodidyma]|uniref:Pectin lyase fold/virulence factor n=1 Tax=Dactylonectria macrodidyma TaxID=307937 RepID=A0A9P9JJH1_9HYPO|nr:pectin lyase fold/virulence factor [Dactylonectria macrodidyma]